MSDKKKNKDYTERPEAEYWNPKLCPTCGNNDFTWGKVSTSGAPAFFNPEGFFKAGKRIDARQCKRCGNVQMFAEQAE